jgi:hypothetical protein
MGFIKLLIQLFTLFGLLLVGVINIDSSWGLGLVLLYWLFYIVINIVVAIWRMSDPDYDVKSDVKNAFKYAKKCPHCMSNLPSYFTSKCPHCTADLQ